LYRIEVLPAALRELERLPIDARRRVAHAIDRLAVDPRARGSMKLRGTENMWRTRAGEYRVLYQLDDDGQRIVIIKVGHRRDVYR
jgi:mRNA interferase RelE/StbE